MTRRLQHVEAVVHAGVLKGIVGGLLNIQIDPTPALERIGFTREQVDALDDDIPAARLQAFWDSMLEISGQSGLGLRIAEQVHPEDYAVFGNLIAASATLGEAALRATRLIRLATNNVRLLFQHDGDRVSFSIEPVHHMHREGIEFMVGAMAVISRHLAGRALGAIEVRFVHSAPPDLTHHQRLFGGTTIQFDSSSNGIVFDGALLDLPVQSRDPDLSAALQQRAETLMNRKQERGLKAEVRAALALELRGGDPSAERVAASLNMHPKTLTRRLRNEGTTFRQLLDQLRRQLAERYLRQPDLSVEEVAFLLGYSEGSAFHRAFRRWTGHAPRSISGRD